MKPYSIDHFSYVMFSLYSKALKHFKNLVFLLFALQIISINCILFPESLAIAKY